MKVFEVQILCTEDGTVLRISGHKVDLATKLYPGAYK